jgi:DNA-binding PadR family transcriptional regulator
MTTAEVLGGVSSGFSKADSIFSNASILLHLTAEHNGMNIDQLKILTQNEKPTLSSELIQLIEKGFVQKFKSAYQRVPNQSIEPVRRAQEGKLSKTEQIHLALNTFLPEELITPLAVWQNFSQEAKEEISLETIIKELSALKKQGKLEATASAKSGTYQITEQGKAVTKTLLVPLVKIARNEKEIMIPNRQGETESLQKKIIPRITQHPEIITNVMQQYQKVGRTPKEIELRKIADTKQALDVYSHISGELLASTIRRQAGILPNDWSGVLKYMLSNGYVSIGIKTGRGREKSYIITEKGHAFLLEQKSKQ